MKTTFSVYLIISLLLHTVLIASFTRVFRADNGHPDRSVTIDTLSWDTYFDSLSERQLLEQALSPYLDSLSLDSLMVQDSVFIHYLTDQLTDNTGNRFAGGWTGPSAELSAMISDLLSGLQRTARNDSLFAVSELLRRRMLQRIMEQLSRRSDSLPGGQVDWRHLIDMLAKRLEQLPGTSGKDTPLFQSLHSMTTDPKLLKLWKEAMHYSLRKAALDSLRTLAEKAAKCGLYRTMNNSGMPAMTPEQFPSKRDCDCPFDIPVFQPGSSCSSGSPESVRHFEESLATILNEMMRATGSHYLLSMVPFDEAVGEMSREAYKALYSALNGDAAGLAWLESVNLEKAIEDALNKGAAANGKAQQAAVELFETITMGLGSDIAAWLSQGPSPAQLRNNPDYFSDWADNYLSVLSRMATTPNMVVPDLDKFAEAARKIRNRYLPESDRIVMGQGGDRQIDSTDYFIPQWIYLPEKPRAPSRAHRSSSLIKPEMEYHAFGGARRKTRPIILDGNLDEWESASSLKLCGSSVGASKLSPELRNSNCLMVQWDNRGLYFAYSIADRRDNPCNTAVFWNTDALELFIDPHNFKDSERVKGRSFQFWIWPRSGGQSGSTGISVFSDPRSFHPRPFKKNLIRYASVRSGDRYTCEAFVPALLMGKWYPLPGKIIGYNFSINNGENVYIRWVTNMGANISLHPNLWGDLLLLGSDAAMYASPDTFMLAGQNLKVTVVDHDMNLVPNAPDNVWVKVHSLSTKDKLPLNLRETGDDTGVFTGTIGTVFALKPKLQGRISTRPGDRIEIYYLDQHCSNGEKNLPVTRTVNVVRGVMTLK